MAEALPELTNEIITVVAIHAGVEAERIGPQTCLWHDLNLAGDDFSELIEELHETFAVTLRGHLGEYCPTEVDIWWGTFWLWPFKRRRRNYRRLTVGELVTGTRSGVQIG